ncbi:membrane-bound PQQ-dependent dehydrogenase, glucose/quinate/shikimate family [Pararhodobacter sp.]|uniref:membrane-bound PQQ-dependent dehydrogenase, glucose/quinate/shikimate family n=1 Tax=Pararhodobacter sp. TaxID=2127056 RepID=UPI002FDDF306
MAPPATPRRRRGFLFWYTVVLSLVLIVLGIVLFAGGIWLIALGGSWYYMLAGLGLLVTGILLIERMMAGIWLYLAVFAGTLAWAFWEAGMDPWAQVPRLVAPTLVLVLVLLTIPHLRRSGATLSRHGGTMLAIGLLAALAGAWLLAPGERAALAQTTPQPGVTPQPETSPQPEAPEDQTQELPDATQPEEAPAEAPAEPLIDYAMAETGADWPAYGGDNHATRYTPLDQFTRDNIADLEVVWEFRTGDMPPGDESFSNQNTPLKIGDQLLICSAMNQVIALDAATGLENWRYNPEVSLDAIPYNATCRGLAYYQSPTLTADDACFERVLMNTLDARLMAIDTATGQLCEDFGTGGIVNLEEGIGHTAPGWYAPSSPPTIVRNIAVVHSQVRDGQRRDAPSGVVRGYNTETGEMEWAWDMGRPGETGLPPEGETYTRGTPNVWTIASGDNELGHVYLPHGVPSVDYWGGMRSDIENEYSTALVALDVTTGQPVWHYQTVRYDVWDYDLGSQGTLIDYPTAEGTVPALVLPTKQSMFWVFDRRTGELLVEVEDRPVPQGGVEPENLSPTQPFVVDFPNLLQPDLEERHMWGMSPLDQLWCRIQFRQSYYEGMYTPPSTDWWIQYPGYNGGSDWGGVAIDTDRMIMVANYNNTANRNRLVPREEVDALGIVPVDEPGAADNAPDDISPQADTPFGIEVNAGWRVPFTDLLCTQPPYGRITAIDLNTREVLWDRPFGTARKNGPFGLPSFLPFEIGTPNNAGAVITATGLVFIAAATDDLIRAIDIDSGETLWSAALPAGGQAGPAMYEVNGRQYLVINAGGHNFMETPIGDYFIAYALPESPGN